MKRSSSPMKSTKVEVILPEKTMLYFSGTQIGILEAGVPVSG
jgi:hypothetical protein